MATPMAGGKLPFARDEAKAGRRSAGLCPKGEPLLTKRAFCPLFPLFQGDRFLVAAILPKISEFVVFIQLFVSYPPVSDNSAGTAT
jgi:hypothetical protein